MYLTKGHNNLAKLNEKTSCICGKVFQTCNSFGSGSEFYITEELYFIFFVFFKRNTPDIKHHIGEDHSNSFQPYHNPQQPRFGFCFLLPTSFKLKVWTTSHQTQNLGTSQGCVTGQKKQNDRATIHHLNKEKLHMLTTHTGKQVIFFVFFLSFANFYLILVMQIFMNFLDFANFYLVSCNGFESGKG